MTLIAVALVAALAAARDAAVMVYRVRDPDTALRLRDWDPVALAAQADRGMAEGRIDLPDDTVLRRALGGGPLNAPLLRLAGLAAQQRGDTTSARRLVQLADRLSRRDLGTEIWLVEDAVEHDDVPGAIAHYHAALAVHPLVRRQFFPVIANALRYRRVRAALIPDVRRAEPWVISFLSDVAVHQPMPAPRNLARLLIESNVLHRDNGADAAEGFRQIASRLLGRLVEEGDYAAATVLADQMPGADRGALNDIAVTPESSDRVFRPLTWQLIHGDGALAAHRGHGQVDVRISQDRQAIALNRVMVLQAGRYRFALGARFSSTKPVFAAGWNWYCLTGRDRQSLIWHGDMAPASGQRRYAASLDIPDGCRAVQIQFVVTGDDAVPTGEMSIKNLTMRRMPA